MSDEFKLLKQRDIGRAAEALRENELLVRIVEGLKKKYIAEWASSDPVNVAARESNYHRLNALVDVWGQINGAITDGKTAVEFLKQYEKQAA